MEKIRKALNQTFDLELTNLSFMAATEKIREQTELNLVVDETAVGQELLDSFKATILRKVRLRSGLQTLLSPYNLEPVILGDVLLITTKDHAADRQFEQPVSVHITNVPLTTALKRLARETATNVVIDPRVDKEAQATPLTMQLEEVPLEMAVRVMAEGSLVFRCSTGRNGPGFGPLACVGSRWSVLPSSRPS